MSLSEYNDHGIVFSRTLEGLFTLVNSDVRTSSVDITLTDFS